MSYLAWATRRLDRISADLLRDLGDDDAAEWDVAPGAPTGGRREEEGDEKEDEDGPPFPSREKQDDDDEEDEASALPAAESAMDIIRMAMGAAPQAPLPSLTVSEVSADADAVLSASNDD